MTDNTIPTRSAWYPALGWPFERLEPDSRSEFEKVAEDLPEADI